MNSIELTNFRRFDRLPKMELGDITLLVGGNNSGKSSLIKAYLLCVDNLCKMTACKKGRHPFFRFDANEWHDVKVKTFERALHQHKFTAWQEGIGFSFTLYGFHFEFRVHETSQDHCALGRVSYVKIHDLENQAMYEADYCKETMTYTLFAAPQKRDELLLIKSLYHDYKVSVNKLERWQDDEFMDEE